MALVPPDSTNQAVEDKILTVVALTSGSKSRKIKLDDLIVSSQDGFDSFSLVEFVLRLEEAFGISIPDQDLDPDIFYSVRTVIAYILARLQQQETLDAPAHR